MKVVRIDDPATEVPSGTQGELLVKGPQVMRGYLETAPDESAAVLDDGWSPHG